MSSPNIFFPTEKKTVWHKSENENCVFVLILRKTRHNEKVAGSHYAYHSLFFLLHSDSPSEMLVLAILRYNLACNERIISHVLTAISDRQPVSIWYVYGKVTRTVSRIYSKIWNVMYGDRRKNCPLINGSYDQSTSMHVILSFLAYGTSRWIISL